MHPFRLATLVPGVVPTGTAGQFGAQVGQSLNPYNKNITGEYNDLILKMLQKKPENRLASLHEFLSKFSRIKIYKDDADPSAGRG